MVNRKAYIVVCAIIVCIGQVGRAQEEKKPWWNPFKSTESAEVQAPVRSSNIFGGSSEMQSNMDPAEKKSWLKMPTMPKLWGSAGDPAKPSPLKRMTDGTKKFWNGTVDLLNPFDSKEEARPNGYMPQYSQRQKQKSGWFDWMYTEEATPEPRTVNDFLRQPRPKY